MDTEYDFSQGKRGAIEPTGEGKTRITIRLDDDILTWFREQVHLAGGGNYQTLINNALCEYVQQHREPLKEILRPVVREELSQINMRINE
ncbi:CopG domain protein DNA-binding domain protein [Calothrix sp. NIES-4071]|nr:CopG domain protein DNA-binding domain protein [Calothrix sp. NIES-4071]BAZ61637.1 CopG domain protein DNA-binding domain protein [Calothrix sp. NIES-4105]